MPRNYRSFIAVELPGNVKTSIGEIQKSLAGRDLGLKMVRPENIHLTLKFLGNVEKEQIGAIGLSMREAAGVYRPMLLRARGLGVFPSIKNPRVIWLGVGEQIEALANLQKSLDEKLMKIGFEPEKRQFKGHLTIARVKGKTDPKRLLELMTKLREFKTDSFTAEEIVLFKSELRPAGPEYSKLSTVSL